VVTSQATRTQARNLEDARAKVRGLVHASLRRPRRRKPTLPPRVAGERRLAEKKRHGALKRLRTRDDFGE
jgi:ribosome-associated protein